MSAVRIGVLGASRVAAYAVIKPASEVEGIEVVAIAARDPERARHYAATHGIRRIHTDYSALLADPELDLVYLGTPPALHAEQALASIVAGKAVLVEKPFALSAEQARLVHAAAVKAGVLVFEAMHSTHHRLFARILEILRSGEIGRVQSMRSRFLAPISEDDPIRWSAELGGGALMDLGVYPLTWLRRIAGEAFSVRKAEAEFRHGVDASFRAELEFPGGIVAELSSSMTAAEPLARLEVVGEQGRLEVRNPIAPQMGHLLTVSTGAGDRTETVDGLSSYAAQLAAIRATLREDQAFPVADDDYVRSMEAIERVRAVLLRG